MNDVFLSEYKADPVREECFVPVKLADLGNACWTVSSKDLSDVCFK